MDKSIADIEAVVLEYYPLQKSKPSELKSKKKAHDLSRVRNVTTYVAKESGYSFYTIAKYYKQKGNSVLQAHRRLCDELSVTPALNETINKILTAVQ
jgi:chromosomal replication initiation ATPase DnaA